MASRTAKRRGLGIALGFCALLFVRYFITGHSILGRPTDNATFLYAATQDVSGRPYERLSAPKWHRLARRWVVLGVPLIFAILWVVAGVERTLRAVDPAWTQVDWLGMAVRWWILATLSGAGWASYKAVQYLRHRETTNEFVYPTWIAACKVLGLSYHRREARRMVEVPDGFEPGDALEVEGPKPHGRLARWTGIARLSDRRAARKEAEQQAQLDAEQAQRESEESDEPETVPAEPSTELVVRGEPSAAVRWRLYRDLFPTRSGSTAAFVEEPVRINLPNGVCGSDAQKKAFLNAVGPVLGIDPDPDWHLQGSAPYVLLRPIRLPPPKVTFADVKQYFEASTLTRPFVGLAAGGPGGAGRPVYLDLEQESPHNLLSGPSGTGKSTLLKTPLPIRMHLGAGLIIGDFKRVSHLWAHNLPGCLYAWRIADIHTVFEAAGKELMRRIEGVLPDDYDHTIDLTQFQVWDILVEEINSLTPMLQRHWQQTLGGSGPSPAIIAIQQIIFMGREMGMHVWVGSQRAAANVFGGDGGSTRENFAARLMAKWTKQTWTMLAGGIPWMKCPKGGRGIWALIQNDEAEIIRAPYLSNAEARAWAVSGVPSPDTPLDVALSAEPSGPVISLGVSVPELVTLSKALEYLPGSEMSLPALRQAASTQRAKTNGFPAKAGREGAADLYPTAELIRWKQDLDARKGIQQSWDAAEPQREAWVYRFDVLDPATGAVVCGYVGQTHSLKDRERQHRGDKPWADLIVGSIVEIWHGMCTQDELDAMELHYIETLLPLYNIEGQEGAEHAVPKWQQLEERRARDVAAGRPLWEPVDVYSLEKVGVI